jgi:hypothetical protein
MRPLRVSMGMRTTRLLGSVAVMLVAASAVIDPVEARTAPPTLRVAGVAGSSYWVDVSPGTQLANAGDYSRSPHTWSGIGLVRPAGSAGAAQVFVSLDLPQSVRCAGATCPWLAPPPDLTSDTDGRLAPGRYRLVLLGARGTPVVVALQPLSGRVRLVSRAPAVPVTASQREGTRPAGHEAVLHTFDEMPGGNGFAVMWSVQYLDVQPAGAFQTQGCATDGLNDTVVSTLGGVAGCGPLGFAGSGGAGPTSIDGTPGYAPVNAAAIGEWGPQDASPMGVGWDASIAGSTSYLGEVFVGFALPMSG